MKKMHVYTIYMDDGTSLMKITIPAISEKDAREYVQGNGEIVAAKCSDLQDIDLNCLSNSLMQTGWGQVEIDVITRALTQVGLNR